MSGIVDLAIVGAGPAGMAAAVEAVRLGLEPVVLDQQAAPGGQIYRNIEGVQRDRPGDLSILGADYAAGLELVEAFRASGVDYRPLASVFEVGTGALGIVSHGVATR
ncbi:MAG: NAD(P)-binding protein, partial [Alphaproteobacteria bacterium]